MINRLKNMVRHIQPQILFLIETKLSGKRMEKVQLKCCFVNGIDVGTHGSKRVYQLGAKGIMLYS